VLHVIDHLGIVPLNFLLENTMELKEDLFAQYQSTEEQLCANGTDAMYNDITSLVGLRVWSCSVLMISGQHQRLSQFVSADGWL
jgi:hypothetical protein